MNLPRRGFLRLSAGAAALPATSRIVQAETYPARPITMVVGASAGGPTDTIGRIITERMRMSLGTTIVIENNGSAAGSIAHGRVARAAPDGYTLSLGHWGTHVVNGAVYALTYDVFKDFEPVALISSNPYLMVGQADAARRRPARARRLAQGQSHDVDPGDVRGGQPRAHRRDHAPVDPRRDMAVHPLSRREPGDAGSGCRPVRLHLHPARPGHAANPCRPHQGLRGVREGASRHRARVPTTDEAGLPGFYLSYWHGLWAPRGTPKDVVAKLSAAVADALADPGVRQRLAELGQQVYPREQQTPEGLAALQKADIDKWWPMIKAANIRAE